MSVRPILIHPDPRLKKVCDPLPAVDDAIQRLVSDMFETMYAAPGIGLAAPQIGVLSRVLVMDCAGREENEDGEMIQEPPDPIAMINPEILERSEELNTYLEGCLSIPEQYENVERPKRVRVRWTDPSGAELEREFDGVRATCVQHEIDHLNGKLFIDYLGPVKRNLITTKMKKLKRERAKEKAQERADKATG